jgi:hypothetical protein
MNPICVLPPVDADRPHCEALAVELRVLEEAAGGPPLVCPKTYYCGRAPRAHGGGGLGESWLLHSTFG